MKTLSFLALLIAVLFTANVNAQARPGQVYHLRSTLNVHYYLSAVDKKTANNTYITTNQTTPTDKASRWTLEDAGGGYYYFRNAGGFYLDVAQASRKAGARLWLAKRNFTDAQKFRLKTAPGGAYYILPKLNEKLAVDVHKAYAAPNSVVWCTSINQSTAQMWKLIPTTSGTGKPQSNPAPRPASSQVKIPKAKMEALGNLVLGTLSVKLNNFGSRHRDGNGNINWYRPNGSTIQFMGETSTFTRSFAANFEANRFVIHATFEEDGDEIKGMCSNCAKFREDNGALDFNFQNNRWKIYLRLVPFGDSFTFEVDDVKFHGQVDGRVFGELFEGIVQRQLEPTVRQALREQLNGQKAAIARAIKQGAAAVGYNWSRVRSVRVVGREVVVTQ